MSSTDAILLAALGLAGFIFWRLHQRASTAPAVPVDDPSAPLGAPYLALGQFAVAPDKLWLLIKPGQ